VPPTPSPTSVALCISVGGSTNNFTATQLAGPDNGFSFFNNVIANPTPTPTATSVPVPTPTATSSGPTPISGGGACGTAAAWPAYGSSNKYQVSLVATTRQWFQVDSNTRTLYSDTPVTIYMEYNPPNNSCFPIGQTKIFAGTLSSTGYNLGSSGGDKFAIFLFAGSDTANYWIV
jgi:hypothetical protein